MNDGFIRRGGMWVMAQFALLSAIAGLGVIYHKEPQHLIPTVIGFAFLTIAAVCGISGAIALGRHLTPFPKPRASTQLVRHGIYGLMRHPLYTAVVSAAIGWSALRQSWPALVATMALAAFFDAKARREERWLRQQFPDYHHYAATVRRFIPWVY